MHFINLLILTSVVSPLAFAQREFKINSSYVTYTQEVLAPVESIEGQIKVVEKDEKLKPTKESETQEI
jgi:hypothetical protein